MGMMQTFLGAGSSASLGSAPAAVGTVRTFRTFRTRRTLMTLRTVTRLIHLASQILIGRRYRTPVGPARVGVEGSTAPRIDRPTDRWIDGSMDRRTGAWPARSAFKGLGC